MNGKVSKKIHKKAVKEFPMVLRRVSKARFKNYLRFLKRSYLKGDYKLA